MIDFFIIFQTEISETNLNQLNGSCLIIFRSHQNSMDLHGKSAIDVENGTTSIKKVKKMILDINIDLKNSYILFNLSCSCFDKQAMLTNKNGLYLPREFFYKNSKLQANDIAC